MILTGWGWCSMTGRWLPDAGLLVAGTLMSRLGFGNKLLDETVRLGDRPGGAYPGRKVLSLVASMLVGGSHIDHADRPAGRFHRQGAAVLGDGPVHIGHVFFVRSHGVMSARWTRPWGKH